MSVNLVTLIMQHLTPDVVGRIASALGMGREHAQAGVAAGVPAILAGLVDLVSRPEGAGRLASALQQPAVEPPAIARVGETGSAEQGAGMLASLLGGGAVSGLAGAVARFAGLDTGSAKSLLGLLTPVVTGVLGQQQRQNGLDAGGLARMLAGQKDAIAAAMPQDFASLLAGTGLVDGIPTRPQPVPVEPARHTPVATTASPRRAPDNRLFGLPRGLALAALALAAVAIGWWLLGRAPEPEVREAATTPTAPVSEPVSPAPVPGTTEGELRTQLTGVLDQLTTALQGVTDTASAQAAVPKLSDLSARLEQVSGRLAQASPEMRKVLATVVSAALPGIRQAAEKALAILGVGELLKPALDTLDSKLEALATA